MNTHDLILGQVKQQLVKQGFSESVASRAAEDGLQYYMTTAQFKRGAINDVVSHAKKRANALAKIK